MISTAVDQYSFTSIVLRSPSLELNLVDPESADPLPGRPESYVRTRAISLTQNTHGQWTLMTTVRRMNDMIPEAVTNRAHLDFLAGLYEEEQAKFVNLWDY